MKTLLDMIPEIRMRLGECHTEFTDEEINAYLNEGYHLTQNARRLEEITAERLKGRLGE